MLLIVAGIITIVAVVANLLKKTGEIEFGSLGADLEATAAIIRDEKIIMSEPYEKITYDVVEGETVNNDQVIAQMYKRGYQDETMVTLLTLQKQIYDYQFQLLGGQPPQELADLNASIDGVELQIRAVSRGESELDMLDLEQTLKDLENQRVTLMQTIVTPDTALTQLYNDLKTQQNVMSGWKRDIKNTSGTGVVSFYFDGYEQVLSVNKLSTINSALVKKRRQRRQHREGFRIDQRSAALPHHQQHPLVHRVCDERHRTHAPCGGGAVQRSLPGLFGSAVHRDRPRGTGFRKCGCQYS